MDKFTVLESVAAPLRIINIDTDMIIPKQYLKTIKRTGLGTGLFSEMRYREDGSENPDFVLNQPAYRKANILVALSGVYQCPKLSSFCEHTQANTGLNYGFLQEGGSDCSSGRCSRSINRDRIS